MKRLIVPRSTYSFDMGIKRKFRVKIGVFVGVEHSQQNKFSVCKQKDSYAWFLLRFACTIGRGASFQIGRSVRVQSDESDKTEK